MKKSKLLFSVMSLCFAVAMFTFGIFAATSVNYAVSGKIAYTVEDAYVELTTKVYKSAEDAELATVAGYVSGNKTLAELATAVTAHEITAVQEIATYNTLTGAAVQGVTGSGGNLASELNDLALNTTDAKVLLIVVNIKNLGANTIHAQLTNAGVTLERDDTALTADQANLVVYNTDKYKSIAQGASVNVVVGFAIKDVKANVEELDFAFNLDIGDGELPSEQLQALNDSQAEQGLFYLTMGKYTDGENVEHDLLWKLVSATKNGTTYTLDELQGLTKSQLSGMSCVFVQEVSVVRKAFIASRQDMNVKVENSNIERWEGISGEQTTGMLANDYYASDVRSYLNNFTNEGYLAALGIDNNNSIYKSIESRTISSLYSNIKKTDESFSYEIEIPTGNAANEADKLWLLSIDEILEFFSSEFSASPYGYPGRVYKNGSDSGQDYILRSPAGYETFRNYMITSSGSQTDVISSNELFAIRAAFNIVL